jgi:integrase
MPRGSSLTFLTFARDYWRTTSPTLAETTRENAERVVEDLISTFGREPLARLTAERVERWWGELRERGRAGRTDNIVLLRLRHLCRAAIRYGHLSQDPTDHIKLAPETEGRVRFFETPEARQRALDAANPVLRDFLTVAHYTGARRRSVWSLEARDVDLVRGTVRFRSPKGARYDLVLPLHDDLRPTLERRCGAAGTGRLFHEYAEPHAATRAWRRLCATLGLGDFRLHDWRHDTASWLVMGTGSLKVAQDVLGHRNPQMTQRYAHLADGYLRDALQKAL